MKIVIVGAGAIGLIFGAHLQRGGNEVVFIDVNPDVVGAINKDGIALLESGAKDPDTAAAVPAKAYLHGKEISECDLVLLAVKSFDTYAAMQSVAHLITNKSPVLTLQTGLGNLELIEKVERRKNILGGFTYMAGASFAPGKVQIGGQGTTFVGELDGTPSKRAEKAVQMLNECGLQAELVNQIVERIWSKVIVYSAINPLSAVLNVKNGKLLEAMESITIAKRLIDEGVAVAEAAGICLEGIDLYEVFFQACRRTSDNVSSMLLDLVNEKKTEIDAINGMILRLGRENNIPVNTHATLFELVKLREKWGIGLLQGL